MTGSEIRRVFLDYFVENGHTELPSSPVVPAEDPTLLFTNAGMNQFKHIFTGEERRPYTRAATAQKCIRVSGKHNDLENVGRTPRHHTFFEMMGNFSFGDYFKEDAVRFGWELLTDRFALPVDRLYATIYEEDDEAEEVWQRVAGIDPRRIHRLGKKDNYWSMGDTGPQGPCSEILFDLAPTSDPDPGNIDPTDESRFLEVWNLVFMQFDAQSSGELLALPKPSIDTGLGLERLTSILQGVESNYDTDLVRPLIDQVCELTGRDYDPGEAGMSHRVIADHIRALVFAISDGVVPANDGRGYVLRRLLRRAARHGRKLEMHEPFMHRLVATVGAIFGDAYAELKQATSRVELVVRTEEERFGETLDQGIDLFEELADRTRVSGDTEIPGREAFVLYDTYGFPLDLTQVMAEERGLEVDLAGFDASMAEQKARSRADRASKGTGADEAALAAADSLPADVGRTFVGYDPRRWSSRALIVALFDPDFTPVERLGQGDEGWVILDQTPFYAESGGQVPDRGEFEGEGFVLGVDRVDRFGGVIFHRGTVQAGIASASEVEARVDGQRRAWIMRNHTATHLMHAALRDILGTHVQQSGSLVEPERLRFDFSHFAAVSDEEQIEVDRWVNRAIWANVPVVEKEMGYQEAIEVGALAFFGDKYGDVVRVIEISGYSTELCGGTHVARTGDIGLFRLEDEGSISSGVRRVEASTAHQAVENAMLERDTLERIAEALGSSEAELVRRITALLEENRSLHRELDLAATKRGASDVDSLLEEIREYDGIRVVAGRVEAPDIGVLRAVADRLRDKLESGIGVLGMEQDGKAVLLCVVTDDLVKAGWKAGRIVSELAAIVGGRGGGKPHLAQAGGPEARRLNEALDAVPGIVRAQGPGDAS
ncbi:alanine--tRNA ligase [Gemmatimonadota bacterium]